MNAAGLATAFAIALAAIGLLRRSSFAALLADHPNERSLHLLPTPRVGGLGLLVGAIPVAAAFATGDSGWIVAIAAGLAVVSAIDDGRSLPVALRLACHFGAAAATVIVIVPTEAAFSMASTVYALLAVLALAWMANLFNFMDGADGLAGGMAALGFSALSIAAHRAGAGDLAMIAGAVAAASVAFLAFNFPPARVFLGDAGSVPLGFLAGAVGVLGMVRGAWPAWFPMLVFSPFVVDATLTLAQRFGRREPVWRAHRSHYYQRLVLGGWSHRRLALHGWALMFATSASALVGREGSVMLQAALLAVWVVAFGALAFGIDRRYPRGQN